ncbi:MAG: gamma-glutamyl-gamma-aminobutyrate hydrolase family protein [Kiritimatiellae bacterium]|nr:gamma-glutamyl-gamma-aminobutyrate hydrolase family protein [Kiritimatiellia bacterium]
MRWRVTAGSARAAEQLAAWIARRGVTAVRCSGYWPSPEEVVADADALLLGGGGDLAEVEGRYLSGTGEVRGCRPARDAAEFAWLRAFAAAGRPVFGVCRGLQLIAVALGGRLIRDLPSAMPQLRERHELVRGDARHGLRVTGDGAFAAALREVTEVNSSHHQAVGALGSFRVLALSPGGVVEAIEALPAAGVRAWAVQWHPERLVAGHPAAERVLDLWVAEADR